MIWEQHLHISGVSSFLEDLPSQIERSSVSPGDLRPNCHAALRKAQKFHVMYTSHLCINSRLLEPLLSIVDVADIVDDDIPIFHLASVHG